LAQRVNGGRLTAGVERVPIGLSRQIDEGDLALPERARIITRATPRPMKSSWPVPTSRKAS